MSPKRTTPREHGTRAKYVVDKCRCTGPGSCTEASTIYNRERDRRSRRPDEVVEPAYVAAGTVRAHLLELRAAGIGRRRVAALTGVAESSIADVVQGRQTRVSRKTAEAILAVMPSQASPGAYVDATMTWELVNRMVAAGVTKAAIGRAVHGPQAKALQLGHHVTKGHADAVAAYAATVLPDLEAPASDDERIARLREDADDWERLQLSLVEVLEARVDQEWRRRAACNRPGIPTRVFFVGRGESIEPARGVCVKCPVSVECAEVGRYERDGVWGGQSGRERRSLRQDDVA